MTPFRTLLNKSNVEKSIANTIRFGVVLETSIYDTDLFGEDERVILKEVNELVEELVKKNKISILYKRKKTLIELPVELDITREIEEDEYNGKVNVYFIVWCTIDGDPSKFDESKVYVSKLTDDYDILEVVWK